MRAHIVDPDIGIVATCSVRDLSATGAKLELEQDIDLPPILWLRFQDDTEVRYCNVKWKHKMCLGVEFALKKYVQVAEEETKQMRRLMSWTNADRRSGRDRRAVTRDEVAADRRSRLERRTDARECVDPETSNELAVTDGHEIQPATCKKQTRSKPMVG
jgi:hypothetical protein